MGIKHKIVVVHGQKGEAVDWNDDHEIDGDIEFNQFEAIELVIENRIAFPAGPVPGQVIYRTDIKTFYVWDGAAWQTLLGVHTHESVAQAGLLDFTACFDATIKQRFYSIPASAWHVTLWDKDGDVYACRAVAREVNVSFAAPVHLPHGAIVTEVVVYGNVAATAETWSLLRCNNQSSASSVMATNNIGSPDGTITNPTINNDNYTYSLEASSLDTDDTIYGARIIYTVVADTQA